MIPGHRLSDEIRITTSSFRKRRSRYPESIHYPCYLWIPGSAAGGPGMTEYKPGQMKFGFLHSHSGNGVAVIRNPLQMPGVDV
jgi:hypothetical protein